jgi:hypothetical protein
MKKSPKAAAIGVGANGVGFRPTWVEAVARISTPLGIDGLIRILEAHKPLSEKIDDDEQISGKE